MATAAAHRRNFGTVPTAVPAGESCNVLGWKVFKPGFWKGDYYSAADCKRTVDNFQKYSTGDEAYVKAKAKLGHDDEQRLANSLGLPNQGRIVDCRPTEDGGFEIDISGVPTATGQEINAGRLNDGSVELEWDVPDPSDPQKTIPGPVLTGVAFLGEEQPGVKGLPAPRATFSERTTGRRTRRIRFSEVDPMNRDDLIAQLKAKGIDVGADPALANLPDEALAALLKVAPAAAMTATPAQTVPPPAPGATMSDEEKKDKDDMAAKFADLEKKNADLSAQFNHLSAAFAEATKDKDDVKAAAAFAKDFQSARATQKRDRAVEIVEKACVEGRVLPAVKDHLIDDLCKLSDEKKDCFAEGVVKGKTPFTVECEKLLARPRDARFSANAKPLGNGVGGIDPVRRKELLGHAGELGRTIIRNETAKK